MMARLTGIKPCSLAKMIDGGVKIASLESSLALSKMLFGKDRRIESLRCLCFDDSCRRFHDVRAAVDARFNDRTVRAKRLTGGPIILASSIAVAQSLIRLIDPRDQGLQGARQFRILGPSASKRVERLLQLLISAGDLACRNDPLDPEHAVIIGLRKRARLAFDQLDD